MKILTEAFSRGVAIEQRCALVALPSSASIDTRTLTVELVTLRREAALRVAVAGVAPLATRQFPVIGSTLVTVLAHYVWQTSTLAGGSVAFVFCCSIRTEHVTRTFYKHRHHQ